MKLFVTALILFSCISSGYAQISDEEFDSEIDKLLKVRTEDLWQMYEKHNNRRVELEKELFAKKQKNNITSDEEKELAEEFLVWLNTSEAGQKFVVEEMSFIPYNADPATTSAGYSLGNSIISYMAADKTLTNAYAGAPKGWATDNFGLQMMENYVNTAEWPETAYSDIADYAISSWAEMAGLE